MTNLYILNFGIIIHHIFVDDAELWLARLFINVALYIISMYWVCVYFIETAQYAPGINYVTQFYKLIAICVN